MSLSLSHQGWALLLSLAMIRIEKELPKEMRPK